MHRIEEILLEAVWVMRWAKDNTSLAAVLTTEEAFGVVQEILKGLYSEGYEIVDSSAFKKKKLDLTNWVKSELAVEGRNKLGKNTTPYRTDKIKFLNKVLRKLNQ